MYEKHAVTLVGKERQELPSIISFVLQNASEALVSNGIMQMPA
jgi:hypothetical protein